MSVIDPQGTPSVPEPQDERLPVGRIAVISVVALGLFAVGVVWSTMIMTRTQAQVASETGTRREGTEVGKPEIGMVDQQQFTREQRNQRLLEEKRARLSTAGWSNRKENLVHIPIEQAMRAVAQGKRPTTLAPPQVDVPRNEPGAQDVQGAQGATPPDAAQQGDDAAPTPAGPGGDTSGDTTGAPDQTPPGASQP